MHIAPGAIAFRASSVGSNGDGHPAVHVPGLGVTPGAGVEVGDVMVVVLSVAAPSLSLVSNLGWTLVEKVSTASGLGSTRWLLTKVADSTDAGSPASYDFSWGGANIRSAAIALAAYYDDAGGTPIVGTAVALTDTSADLTIDWSEATYIGRDIRQVLACAVESPTYSNDTNTAPTGFTIRVQQHGFNRCRAVIMDKAGDTTMAAGSGGYNGDVDTVDGYETTWNFGIGLAPLAKPSGGCMAALTTC